MKRLLVACSVLVVVVVSCVLLQKGNEPTALKVDVVGRDDDHALAEFNREHVRGLLQILREEYPVKSVRDLVDVCMGVYDRGGVTFLVVRDLEGSLEDQYAQVLNGTHPNTFFISFAGNQLMMRQRGLNQMDYEDLLVIVFTHECLHLRQGVVPENMDWDEFLRRESEVWWDIAEQVILPMRQEGRAQLNFDAGLILSPSFMFACDEGRECDLWKRFIATIHERPGSEPLNELTEELGL